MIALAVSGALNFFLLGLIAVHVIRPARDHIERRRELGGAEGSPAMLREMMHALGGPKDLRVQKMWASHRGEWRAARQEMKLARAEVRAALATSPFDARKLEEALARLHEATSRAQARSRAAVVTLANELSPEQRQHLGRRWGHQ